MGLVRYGHQRQDLRDAAAGRVTAAWMVLERAGRTLSGMRVTGISKTSPVERAGRSTASILPNGFDSQTIRD